MSYLAVFIAVAVSDWCWVRCVTSANDGHRWSAANWSTAVYALQSVSVVEYTRNLWMLIPALLGAYVGTALGVRKKQEPRHGE